MHLACASLVTVLVIFLAAPAAAMADETTPCPADQVQPTLSVVEPGSTGALYATHLLRANLEWSESGSSADARSFTAPGAQIFVEDDANRPMLVSDTPGPLTLTAVVVIRDPDRYPSGDDYSCTTTVATTVELQPPEPSVFGKFRRPRYIVPARRLYSPHPVFSFTVKLASAGADRSPFTVRARGSNRLKVPGAGAKAVSHEYPLRDFEISDEEESRSCELLCSPVTGRGFQKRVAIRADMLEFRPGGIKITVDIPTGVHFFARGDERFKPTPFGVDVEVFQSGRRIARLRVAARCDSYGQSSTCRFKTINTRH